MDILKKVKRGFRSKKSSSIDSNSPQWTPNHNSNLSRPQLVNLREGQGGGSGSSGLRARQAASLGAQYVRRTPQQQQQQQQQQQLGQVGALVSPTHCYANVTIGNQAIYGKKTLFSLRC